MAVFGQSFLYDEKAEKVILFLSANRQNSIRIRRTLIKSGIMSYQRGFPVLENAHGMTSFLISLPEKPTIALIDSSSPPSFGVYASDAVKAIYPDAVCIVLYDRREHKSERFRYYPNADYEIDISRDDEPNFSLLPLITSLGYSLKYSFKHLKLGDDRASCLFLGYPIKLTETEYRILLYMCSCDRKVISAEEILAYCFAESYRMSITNVRSHISSINRKAKSLGGRKLILSVREKGYMLNEYM